MTRPEIPPYFPRADQPQPMEDAPEHLMHAAGIRPDCGLTRDDLDRMPIYRAARRDAEAARIARTRGCLRFWGGAALVALLIVWGAVLLAHVPAVALHHYANPAVIQH
jgi:hypothetical protein